MLAVESQMGVGDKTNKAYYLVSHGSQFLESLSVNNGLFSWEDSRVSYEDILCQFPSEGKLWFAFRAS